MGMVSQDAMGTLKTNPGKLGINLTKVSLISQRSLSLHMRDGTTAVQGGDLLDVLMDRCKDNMDQALTDLNDQYPAITAAELMALTHSIYAVWENGRTRTHNIDGLSSDTQSRPDAEIYEQFYTEPRDRYSDPTNIATLPGYLVESGRFAQLGQGLLFSGGTGQIWLYLQAPLEWRTTWVLAPALRSSLRNLVKPLP